MGHPPTHPPRFRGAPRAASPSPPRPRRSALSPRARTRCDLSGSARFPLRAPHPPTHAYGDSGQINNRGTRLDRNALTLMVCDRIRVAATVCNETENYGSVDRDRTPQPTVGEGAGWQSGSPRTTPDPRGQKPRGASLARLSGEALGRRPDGTRLTSGSGTRF